MKKFEAKAIENAKEVKGGGGKRRGIKMKTMSQDDGSSTSGINW